MPTVRFNLRNPSGETPQPINLIFRFQNDRLKYAVGFSVLPKYWNPEKERIKNVTTVPNRDAINNHLNDLQAEISKAYADMVANKERVSVEALKKHLDYFTGKTKETARDLFGFIRAFIQAAPTRTVAGKGNLTNKRTVQKYKTTLSRLEEFAKTSRRKVDFETIDLDFYNDFLEFLHRKGYSANTVGKYIATLKVFLNDATLKEVNAHKVYKARQFRVIEEESESVYLTEDELTQLFDLDLSDNQRVERVRDLFLIGAWTGLRFSDFTRLSADNIKGDQIRIHQFKGGKPVIIPIHPTVKAILEKYKNKLPAAISNQKTNEYLKEICHMAQLCEPVAKGITKGGARIIKTLEKWELVSSHTARRSFATNLFKSGFPSLSIMQITGHKTEKAFLKYIKATPEEHAKLLQLHWQGKNNHLKVV